MRMNIKWMTTLMLTLTATTALAETAAGKDDLLSQKVSLMEMLSRGGVVMVALGVMSIVALALVIYFFFILRRNQVVPQMLKDDVLDKLEAGELADARSACGYKPCAFSEVTVAAIDYARTGDISPALMKDVVESEGGRQALIIQGQTQYLFDLAVLSPMVGLLGTVFGMIHAFNAVALDLTKAKPMLLAAGVGEALIATAAGLIVGIPAMAFYAYFRNRAARIIAELEVSSGQVMNILLSKRGK
ncbi:MAG: MotA/TolQ/ExbB proton channel family protein [bacterium]